VVRRLLVLPKRKGTRTLAVVGVVTFGRDDPPRPPYFVKVNVELLALARLLLATVEAVEVGAL
jgi:hypothetical protein